MHAEQRAGSLVGGDDVQRRRRRTSTVSAVRQAVAACEALNIPGSVRARRLLLDAGAPRSRAGALAEGSLHRRWYLHATGDEWDGSWPSWMRATDRLRHDGAARPEPRSNGLLRRLLTAVEEGQLAAGGLAVHRALSAEYGRAPRYRARQPAGSDAHSLYYLVTGNEWDGERASWRAALLRARDRGRDPARRARHVARWRQMGAVRDDGGRQQERAAAMDDGMSDGSFAGADSEDDDRAPTRQRGAEMSDMSISDVDSEAEESVPPLGRRALTLAERLRPVQYAVPFWGGYVHCGTSLAPHGVRPQDTISWLLCVLLADACGLGHLFPPGVVPRPADDHAIWTSVPLLQVVSWRRLVALMRIVLEARHLDQAAMVERLDGQAHWPARLQEEVVVGVQNLESSNFTQREEGHMHMLASCLAEVARELALDIQGRSLFGEESFVSDVSLPALSAVVAARADICTICHDDLEESPSVEMRCCQHVIHRACLVRYLRRAGDVVPACVNCQRCLACIPGCRVPCAHREASASMDVAGEEMDVGVALTPRADRLLQLWTDVLSSSDVRERDHSCICCDPLTCGVALTMRCCNQSVHRRCFLRWLDEDARCMYCRFELVDVRPAPASPPPPATRRGGVEPPVPRPPAIIAGRVAPSALLLSAEDAERLQQSAELLEQGAAPCGVLKTSHVRSHYVWVRI